ncbi:Transcriptional regulator, HxlR family [Labilithrix luteola]|uniref:Transcriptional regulator, HxlR family n=2 Tax=Labilithrix luteola TaxID=1391654 RepID=A0A0K1PPJ2_9BACT|nr:Transcriptional regulator, HxlR family [Labilithrix luteola]
MLIAVLEDGPLRFSEIGERIPSIGDRMLAARLKDLECRGVIARSVDAGPPVRVSYTLTDVGRGYKDVANALSKWGKMILESGGPCPKTSGAEAKGASSKAARPRRDD